MKKITKRIFSLLMVALLLSATACSAKPGGNSSNTMSAINSAESSVESGIEFSSSDESNITTDSSRNQPSGSTGSSNTKSTVTTSSKSSTTVKKVTFKDLDLSNLKNLQEAPGADSGVNGTLYVIDTDSMRERLSSNQFLYDATKFSVSLQGLENRKNSVIYMKDGTSTTWLTFLRAQTDGLLYGKKIVTLKTIDAVVKTLGDRIKSYGIVVWDPAQPFTSNIATNVCGVEGYLPVMYSDDEDSLYMKLIGKFGQSIVKMDLRGKFTGKTGSKIWGTSITSSGSAKCDAYLWAMEKYVKTNKTSKDFIAYMTDFYPLSSKGTGKFLDNSIYETYLPSQDYIVANKIFTFDLSIFKDEPATDDPTQASGLDYRTLQKLLQYQYDRNGGKFSQCIGFPPFVYKYTTRVGGKYDDTMAEWTTVEVMTAYNIAVQADCPGPSSFYNCSVFEKYTPQVKYTQAEKRKKALSSLPTYDSNTTYLYIYMGDYDAASWTYHTGTRMWASKDRGEIPLAWAFNPNLMQRLPMVWDYFYSTATNNDFFIAGDSGAGYINSNLLQAGKRKHSTLPSGLEAWKEWCTSWYKKADITITGMLLDGNNGYASTDVLKACSSFSPDGIGVWNWPSNDSGMSVVNNVAVSGMSQYWGFDQNGTVENAANALIDIIDNRRNPRFYPVKLNIANPTLVTDAVKLAKQKLVTEGKGRKIEVVDPYTFYAMMARELKKK